MEYKVSEKVQKKFDTLTKDAKVQKALQFMEEDQDTVIDKQIELTLIPAPTNHEQKKAARLLEMFKEEGLTDCHIDEYGNCVGIRKGTGGGKTVLVEGHMDTVFPLDTKLEIVREDGFIKCPGIVDDTRGCADGPLNNPCAERSRNPDKGRYPVRRNCPGGRNRRFKGNAILCKPSSGAGCQHLR